MAMLLHLKPKMKAEKGPKRHKSYAIELLFIVCALKCVCALRAHRVHFNLVQAVVFAVGLVLLFFVCVLPPIFNKLFQGFVFRLAQSKGAMRFRTVGTTKTPVAWKMFIRFWVG